MNHYVYEITNNINGMKYMGKRSCNCEIEKDSYMGGGTKLQEAKDKFGIDNFSKKILAIADDESMALDLENYYIEHRNAVESPLYYNQVYGGDISHMFKHHDKEKQERVRKMISQKNKGTNAGENSKVARKVICLNTEEVFVSGTEASKSIGVSKSTIFKACKFINSIKTAGFHPETGERLRWMYYDEYLKESKDGSIQKRFNIKSLSENGKKVVCLNTNEVFNTITEASSKYNISGISKACYTGCTAGKHPIIREKLRWMHYEDFIGLNREDVDNE